MAPLFGSVVFGLLLATSTAASHPAEYANRLPKRIVGGTAATSGQFPQIGALLAEGDVDCGVTLLNENWALTAAHCVDSGTDHLQVRFGSLTIGNGGRLVALADAVLHPEWRPDNINNHDLALIQLAEPVLETPPTIRHAKLPLQGSDPAAGSAVTVAGWGLTKELSDDYPASLLYTTVKVVERKKCVADYKHDTQPRTITDNMVCTGVPGGGKDACTQDSGGPLVDESGVLVGVVTGGKGCGQANFPGLYVRVGKYVDWIQKTMNSA